MSSLEGTILEVCHWLMDLCPCYSPKISTRVMCVQDNHMSNRQDYRKTKVVGSGLGMFKFVRKPSQPIGGHPLTHTIFSYIAWKYTPSQPVGDHPLLPCPLRVVYRYVCPPHTYIYNIINIDTRMIPYVYSHILYMYFLDL